MDFFATKVAYAQAAASTNKFDVFVGNIDRMIVNPLIYLIFALALAYFLFGMLQFILGGDNEEKRTTGKSHMLWGIVGLTVMFGVWTMLNLILKTFDIKGIDPKNSKVELPNLDLK